MDRSPNGSFSSAPRSLNTSLNKPPIGMGRHVDPASAGAEPADAPGGGCPLAAGGKKLSVQTLDSGFSRLAGHRSKEGFEREKQLAETTTRTRQQSSPPLTPQRGDGTPMNRSLRSLVLPSIPPAPSPEELFPGDETMQELERKDREWLQYRHAERLKQEKEDTDAFENRLEARKKNYYIQSHAKSQKKSGSVNLITPEDRRNFRILVGIDKKKAKDHATGLVHATLMASHKDNKVHLYNCYKKHSTKRGQETKAHLEAIREQMLTLREGQDISISCENTTKEKACALVEKAHELSVDLIVLGMKAEEKTFFARKVSPGVVDSCPEGKAVLLVPPPSPNMPNLDKNRVILFCYDGTPHCERSLVYLAHSIKKGDKVVVCTVVTPAPKLVVVAQSDDRASLQPNLNYESILSQRVQTAEKQVERVKNQLIETLSPDFAEAEDIDTELRIVDPGKATVSDIIMEVARHLNCDLIVLGSRGIDGWQKVVQGAVTQSILQTATQRSILIAR